LERTPGRVLTLLSAINRESAIARILGSRGYTPAEHERGWALLQAAAGFGPLDPGNTDIDDARRAYDELNQWDEPHFRVFGAALYRLHPDAHSFVFSGLEASKGPASVMGVDTFLTRIDALESSPERSATRDADHAAVATLAARGLTATERTRLRALVTTAKTLRELPVVDEAAIAEREKGRQDALFELYLWFNDWSTTARTAVRRRDHLLALGLARRRTGNGEIEVEIVDDAETTV
jgi:hypothetical protein